MVLELALVEILSYMRSSQDVPHMYVPESEEIMLVLSRTNYDGPILSVTIDTARFFIETRAGIVEFCMNEEVPVRIMVDATMRQTKHIKKVAEAMQR